MNTKKNPKVYQTRRLCFSASHRLHSPALSDEVNYNLYGKCNHVNGHGHNYIVKVTLFGELDVSTGMVMNMTVLNEYMEEAINKPLDHKNLDKDVEYFKDKPSTTENLTIYIWERMKQIMQKPELLYEVQVEETEKSTFIYRGE